MTHSGWRFILSVIRSTRAEFRKIEGMSRAQVSMESRVITIAPASMIASTTRNGEEQCALAVLERLERLG